MAKRGGQPGNNNGGKSRAWEAALRRHFTQNPQKLAQIALVVADAALSGESWAVKEIGDRLDGKPVQQVDLSTGDNHNPRDLSDAELLDVIRQQSAKRESKTLN
jgi:hypothetical protein